MSNLQLISNNTFGSGTNHSITNCFSSDYDVYKITLVDYDAGGGGANLNMRFIDGSGVVSDSDYDHSSKIIRGYGAFGSSRSKTADLIDAVSYDDTLQVGNGTVIYVFNPHSSSTYTFAMWENSSQSTIGTVGRKGVAALHQAVSITGVNFVIDGSTNFSLEQATVYGLKVD